ncbi:MAG: ABC transporter ATP-binding protein, partial [Nanoarchaeota archaeon]
MKRGLLLIIFILLSSGLVSAFTVVSDNHIPFRDRDVYVKAVSENNIIVSVDNSEFVLVEKSKIEYVSGLSIVVMSIKALGGNGIDYQAELKIGGYTRDPPYSPPKEPVETVVSSCNSNSICEPQFENYQECPADCSCGDSVCDSLEDKANCPEDCDPNYKAEEPQPVVKPSVRTNKFNYKPYLISIVILLFISVLVVYYFLFFKDRYTIDFSSLKRILPASGPKAVDSVPTLKAAVKEPRISISSSVKEAINVTDLSFSRGKKQILNGISFSINRGDIVSVLGGSGVGKSTLIECMVLRQKVSSGEISIFENDIYKNPGIFKSVGFVPQSPEIYMDQTVMQNMINSATKWGVQDAALKIETSLKQVKLSNRKDVTAKNLSGGQKKLLSLAMELIHDSELLILDEPTTGLDPKT